MSVFSDHFTNLLNIKLVKFFLSICKVEYGLGATAAGLNISKYLFESEVVCVGI